MGIYVFDPMDPTPREHERPSGVPAPYRFGAARHELYGLFVAVGIFFLIAFAFWFEALR
jgi:hypothetical protein